MNEPTFRCQHPRTEETYERKMERLERAPRKEYFCASCAGGSCGSWHFRNDVNARCLKTTSAREDAHVCACGAAWALTWWKEVQAGKSRRPKNAAAVLEDAA